MSLPTWGAAAAANLAWIAYTDSDLTTVSKADFNSALQDVDSSANGPWQVVWGPVFNDGIVAYVAQGADSSICLAFRGTNPAFISGATENFIADADVDFVTWQYPLSWGAQITGGTNQALALAISATDPTTGLMLLEFLRGWSAPAIHILITGHSLGGGLAMAAAMWLSNQLPLLGLDPYINLVTFAAPTVTDETFANNFSNVFPDYSPYVNTNDVVPMFWNRVSYVEQSFNNWPGDSSYPAIDWSAWSACELFTSGYDETTYIPLGNASNNFTIDLISTTDWLTEVVTMHSMQNTYFSWVNGGAGPNLPNATTSAIRALQVLGVGKHRRKTVRIS